MFRLAPNILQNSFFYWHVPDTWTKLESKNNHKKTLFKKDGMNEHKIAQIIVVIVVYCVVLCPLKNLDDCATVFENKPSNGCLHVLWNETRFNVKNSSRQHVSSRRIRNDKHNHVTWNCTRLNGNGIGIHKRWRLLGSVMLLRLPISHVTVSSIYRKNKKKTLTRTQSTGIPLR